MTDERTDAGCEEAIKAVRDADGNGDNRTAYRLLDEAVTHHPDSVKLWALRSVSLLWRGRHEEALAALGRAREIDGAHPWTLTAEADVAVFEGRIAEAKQFADQVLVLDDTDSWIFQRLPSVYLVAKDYEKAVAMSDRWCQLYPDSAEAFAFSIGMLHAAGQSAESMALLEEAERRFPYAPRIWHARARQLMQSQRLDEAVELLQKAVSVQPGNWMMWSELASVLSFAKRGEEAVAAAETALEMSACATIAMGAMARVCQQRGHARQAAEWRTKAAKAIPAMGAAQSLHKANEAIRRGRWKEALATLDASMPEMAPMTRGVALEIRARALLNLGKLRDAESIIEELEAAGCRSPVYRELLATLYQKNGDDVRAVSILKDGITQQPGVGELRAHLLSLYHAAGMESEVAALVEDTFANLPRTPWGFLALVTALLDTGYLRESREIGRIGMERFPNAEELSVLAALQRLEVGDTDGARRLVAGVKGEWREVANAVTGAASFMDRLPRLLAPLARLFKRGDKPPTLH